ncbi:trigger factor [soil metagenome]
MASVTKENIGELHDKLTVKVSKDDYYPSFEKAVKDYSKKANIPGFRKGMVPPGMIKKMYGSSIFYDEVIKAVEKELQEYLTKEKPQIFAQPLPIQKDISDLDMANPIDYEFPFELGVKPEIDLEILQTAKPVLHKVKVTDKMVDEEVEKLVTKHGEVKDAEEVTVPENILKVSFEESDAEGNVVADAFLIEEESILIKSFSEQFRDQLLGKKKDDTIILQFNKAFDKEEKDRLLPELGFDKNDATAGEKFFNMTIEEIALIEKRDLNEEFFKMVFPAKEINTREEFKTALKEDLQHQWDQLSRSQMHDQLYHQLIDAPVQFPNNFLKRWLAIGGDRKKSEEEVETEYPTFLNQLKWTLLSDKILQENKIEVTNEELRSHLRKEISQYFGQMNLGEDTAWLDSYIDRMMQDEKHAESTYRKILTEKLFDWLETQVTPEEQEVSPDQLLAKQHHHHH